MKKHVIAFLCIASSHVNYAQDELKYKTTDSGLEYAFIQKGEGQKAKPGYRVYVNFTTRIKPDTVFDSSAERDVPYSFILGQEEVLPGWDEGISMMREGDSVHFKLPPQLAYGNRKVGKIPPQTTLFLEVKLLKAEEAFYPIEGRDTIKFKSGLKKIVVAKSKEDLVTPFHMVTMKFTGYLVTKKGYKKVFQSSQTNSALAKFQLGAGRMIKGLDEGIATMRIGEKSTFIVPPELGFGTNISGVVPANSTLYYDIELLECRDPFWKVNNTDTIRGKDGLRVLKTASLPEKKITKESVVVFDYMGYYLDSLKHPIIFDNTYERNAPAVVRPGSKSALPGFSEGLIHLKNGEKAMLWIPPSLGYGSVRKGVVPPNTFLIYQVNILDVKEYPFYDVKGLDTLVSTTGLKSIKVKSGKDSSVVADSGKTAVILYTGFVKNEKGEKLIFDATRENGQPFKFPVDQKKVISGLNEAIKGMRVGDAKHLIIPYELGYGKKGVPDAGIPPKATLYFDVELIGIE